MPAKKARLLPILVDSARSALYGVVEADSTEVAMCCDGCDTPDVCEEVHECPNCGEDVDEDGEALESYHWSLFSCETCGAWLGDGYC